MKVELLDYQPNALNLLLLTKNTRLANDDDPAKWPFEKQMQEIEYMRDTIKSSWSFVDYTFRISGVTRAFTHQYIRSDGAVYAEGEFAQESQRTVDVRDHEVIEPKFNPLVRIHGDSQEQIWRGVVNSIKSVYGLFIDSGMPVQDARGLLPTNTTTSLIAKKSLRQMHFDALVRLCVRTQGEYQEVFRLKRELILGVHPWAEQFIDVQCASEGTCAFPRYGKAQCPIYDPRMDLVQLKADTKKKFWSSPIHVANPKAKDGRSM